MLETIRDPTLLPIGQGLVGFKSGPRDRDYAVGRCVQPTARHANKIMFTAAVLRALRQNADDDAVDLCAGAWWT